MAQRAAGCRPTRDAGGRMSSRSSASRTTGPATPLTRSEMMAAHDFFDGLVARAASRVSGTGYEPAGRITQAGPGTRTRKPPPPPCRELARLSTALCNTVPLARGRRWMARRGRSDGRRALALRKAGLRRGAPAANWKARSPSMPKYSLHGPRFTVSEGRDHRGPLVKGAPETHPSAFADTATASDGPQALVRGALALAMPMGRSPNDGTQRNYGAGRLGH